MGILLEKELLEATGQAPELSQQSDLDCSYDNQDEGHGEADSRAEAGESAS